MERVDTKIELDKTHIRLHFLEKPLEKWMTVGKDMRWNIYAVFMTMACFVVVFGSAITYEDYHLRLEALATLSEEQLDKTKY